MGLAAARGEGGSVVTLGPENAHLCQAATTTDALGSLNVMVNGMKIHRNGDQNEIHTHNPTSCTAFATAVTATTTTVYANSLAVARVDDTYPCGAVVGTGSPNVNVGD